MPILRFLATAAICFIAATPTGAAPITFEDIGPAGDGIPIPDQYNDLKWSNFRVLDVIHEINTFGPNGYTSGAVSSPNVAYNFLGQPASISSATGFRISSLRAAAAWRDGLSLTISALRNRTSVFSQTYTLSTQGGTTIQLDLDDITRLDFLSFGGLPSILNGDGTHFMIDDINVTNRLDDVSDVPVPAAFPLLLSAFAGLGMLRRMVKRRNPRS